MMSRSKHDRIHSQLSSVAQKVYAAIPISDAWQRHLIQGELRRQQVHINPRTLDGCLSALLEVGLIVGEFEGEMRRAPIRERLVMNGGAAHEPDNDEPVSIPSAIAAATPVSTNVVPIGTAPADVFDIVGACEAIARGMRSAADEIESAGLAAAQQIEDARKRMAKFESLTTLLGELGVGAVSK